ncbi:hypothetical protein HanRHA438_Chr10g0474791 [Helianthus annuus]|nr:hypothetical protein HanIR_Chr10g0498181 [Helianthus annuus]KAJ0881484.1 hypothetical protein HanRHA438_Chr10g0474791 [Helianthus annuus]
MEFMGTNKSESFCVGSAKRVNLDYVCTGKTRCSFTGHIMPVCLAVQESCDHFLVTCGLANQVWTQLCLWINIPAQFTLWTVAELVKHVIKAGTSEKTKRVLNLVAMGIFWRLWMARNDRVFNSKPALIVAVVA